MADTGKNTVHSSTAGGSTPEVQESNNHQLTQALQGIAKAQFELSHIIEMMQTEIAKGRVPKVGRDVMLTLVRTSIATTKTLTEMAAGSLPTEQHFHLSQFNKASEALHIPGIAENILSHLGAEDLTCVELVNHQLFNTIQGSPILQTNLFRKPRLTGPFEMLPSTDTVHVYGSRARRSPLFLDIEGLHAMDTVSGTGPTPTPGSLMLILKSDKRLIEKPPEARLASMLVCQPPVHVMKVTMTCTSPCRFPDMKGLPVDSDGNFVLKAEHGITVGQIVETIKTMRELHQPCWQKMRDTVMKRKGRPKYRTEAKSYDIYPAARDYYIWPVFSTVVSPEQDDPMLLQWKADLAEYSPAAVAAFVQCNAEGFAAILPTMQEFTTDHLAATEADDQET